jgi:hypothetical protein
MPQRARCDSHFPNSFHLKSFYVWRILYRNEGILCMRVSERGVCLAILSLASRIRVLPMFLSQDIRNFSRLFVFIIHLVSVQKLGSSGW